MSTSIRELRELDTPTLAKLSSHDNTAASAVLIERHSNEVHTAAVEEIRGRNCGAWDADDIVAHLYEIALTSGQVNRHVADCFVEYWQEEARQLVRTWLGADTEDEDITEIKEEDVLVVDGDPEELLEIRENALIAMDLFHELSDRDRAILWHVEVEQRPLQDVAELLGITLTNVSTLVSRARIKLRKRWPKEPVRTSVTKPVPRTRQQLVLAA